MFHSEKKVKERPINNEENPLNYQGIKLKFTNFDHSFVKDNDGTEFTLLDPFHRPYTYLIVSLVSFRIKQTNRKRNSRLRKMI